MIDTILQQRMVDEGRVELLTFDAARADGDIKPGRFMNNIVAGTTFTTTIRPTPHKDLHLGHAWVAWHNWRIKTRMGGKFVLLLDDELHRLQRLECDPTALPIDQCEDRYLEALEWLGCPADVVGRSSEARELMLESAQRLQITEPRITEPETNLGIMWRKIGVIGHEAIQYSPWVTLAAAVEHRFFGVTGFVRGMDLAGEAYLYDFMCMQLGWVPPEQWYVPLVRRGWGTVKESTSSAGIVTAPSLLELKQYGLTGEEVIDTLRELDWRRNQEGRDAINIPNDVLVKPVKPMSVAWHLKEVPA